MSMDSGLNRDQSCAQDFLCITRPRNHLRKSCCQRSFTGERAEAQGGEVTSPMSHGVKNLTQVRVKLRLSSKR